MGMIKVLFMDVDGTLTDGKVYIGSFGEMFKSFDIKDGYAIKHILPAEGIIPVLITGRDSDIVSRRAEELGIVEVHQGCVDKFEKMVEVARKYGIELDENGELPFAAYIGDDIPDIDCMRRVQVSGCPADSVKEVIECSDYVCKKGGGEGAVREFIEYLIHL